MKKNLSVNPNGYRFSNVPVRRYKQLPENAFYLYGNNFQFERNVLERRTKGLINVLGEYIKHDFEVVYEERLDENRGLVLASGYCRLC